MADTLVYFKTNNYALRNITATNKYYTFLHNEDIFVGPLKPEVIDIVEERSNIFKLWETPYVILPVDYQDEWVLFDNFAKDYNMVEAESKENTNKGFWIAHFYEIDKLNKVCETEDWVYTADLLEA